MDNDKEIGAFLMIAEALTEINNGFVDNLTVDGEVATISLEHAAAVSNNLFFIVKALYQATGVMGEVEEGND